MAREPNEVKARCFQDSVGQRGKLQNNTKGGLPTHGLQYLKI